MSKETSSGNSLWNGYQLFFSLTILTILCGSFYLMGLYIGRWSSVPAGSSINVEPKAQASTAPSETPTLPQSAAEPNANAASNSLTPPELAPSSDKYSVQITTTGTKAEANEIILKLRKAGFDSAHVVDPEPNSVVQFYTVKVGPYKLDVAQQVAEELKNEHGFDSAQITTRQGD